MPAFFLLLFLHILFVNPQEVTPNKRFKALVVLWYHHVKHTVHFCICCSITLRMPDPIACIERTKCRCCNQLFTLACLPQLNLVVVFARLSVSCAVQSIKQKGIEPV